MVVNAKKQVADGVTQWFRVEIKNRGFGRGRWEPVPGWYTLAEARSLRAAVRRCGYDVQLVRCTVVR